MLSMSSNHNSNLSEQCSTCYYFVSFSSCAHQINLMASKPPNELTDSHNSKALLQWFSQTDSGIDLWEEFVSLSAR